MPWYRTDNGKGTYHALIRGKNGSPPACRAAALPGDNEADGSECGRISEKLCDAPVGRSGSCDMPICARHATHVEGKDLDYCPRHAHLAQPVTGDPRRI